MKPLWWPLACIVAIAVSSSSASAQTVWQGPAPDAERLGIIVGEWGSEAEAVNEQLSARAPADRGVLVRKAPVEVDEADSTTRRIQEIRGQGRELYFFSGEEAALEYLTPRLWEKIAIARPWMGDRASSDALFEAVIYVVRAHIDGGDELRGKQWMQRLVQTLPAHPCDDQICPPDVRQMWEMAQRQHLGSARLDLSSWRDGRDCEVLVNGAPAAGTLIGVVATRTYLVGHQCDTDDESRQWWVRAGEDQTYPVEPFDESLNQSRLDAAFDRWQSQWDLDVVVYVGPGDCDGVCVAIRDAHGADRSEKLQRFRPELLDSLAERGGDIASLSQGDRSTRSSRSSYAGDANSPSPWAIQIAMSARAKKYQVNI